MHVWYERAVIMHVGGGGGGGGKAGKLQKKLKQIEDQLLKIDETIKAQAEDGSLDAVCGFVIFNSQEAQRDCLRHYLTSKKAWWCFTGSTFLGWEVPLWLLNYFQKEELKFPGGDGKLYALRIAKAPEPSNILWENLEVDDVTYAL
eukprot:Tamp_22560.p1 GENE.Tamp_22560~~Tamp_22560.p1  ORF type:complete len:146 (-),score=41.57 Tamp_22560:420-857(-)